MAPMYSLLHCSHTILQGILWYLHSKNYTCLGVDSLISNRFYFVHINISMKIEIYVFAILISLFNLKQPLNSISIHISIVI